MHDVLKLVKTERLVILPVILSGASQICLHFPCPSWPGDRLLFFAPGVLGCISLEVQYLPCEIALALGVQE